MPCSIIYWKRQRGCNDASPPQAEALLYARAARAPLTIRSLKAQFLLAMSQLHHPLRRRSTPSASRAFGALAIAALAFGALAIGAVAIGSVAIGRLKTGRAQFKRMDIDELRVRRLILPPRPR